MLGREHKAIGRRRRRPIVIIGLPVAKISQAGPEQSHRRTVNGLMPLLIFFVRSKLDVCIASSSSQFEPSCLLLEGPLRDAQGAYSLKI
jgi:hypothetical protein